MINVFYYNFPENTDPRISTVPTPAFAATPVELNVKTINDTGVYKGLISFPAITGNDGYKLILLPKGETEIASELSFEKNYESPKSISFSK